MKRSGIGATDIQEFEGLDDLNEIEAIEKDDLDTELVPSVYHFHPEAYGKEDWSK